MTRIASAALVFGLALVVGFGLGYETKSRFVQAEKFDAVESAQAQTRTNVRQSLDASTAIEVSSTASSNQVSAIRKSAEQRFEAQHARSQRTGALPNTATASDSSGSSAACVDWFLDLGTLGLLNAARTGADPGAAGSSDAESQASSGLGAKELIDNDLQVVEQYRDLAIRHDALVDYVQTIIEK